MLFDSYVVTLFDVDIKECKNGLHHCHTHAKCIERQGSYDCKCRRGSKGDGLTCRGVYLSSFTLIPSVETTLFGSKM